MIIQLKKYDVLASTNETASIDAKQGAAEGTVIVAARQEGGHGRMQRVWNSPEGGLWFTIILRPDIEPQYVAQVTLLSGVAVAKGIRRAYGDDNIFIKWPNDLLWKNRKVSGILSEMELDENGEIAYAIVGIGVNVGFDSALFPEDLHETAAVLNEIFEKKLSCDYVLKCILQEFIPLYSEWQRFGSANVLKQWRDLNCTLGKKVNVKDNDEIIFRGVAQSVDDQGSLVVEADNGERRSYDFGEISIR